MPRDTWKYIDILMNEIGQAQLEVVDIAFIDIDLYDKELLHTSHDGQVYRTTVKALTEGPKGNLWRRKITPQGYRIFYANAPETEEYPAQRIELARLVMQCVAGEYVYHRDEEGILNLLEYLLIVPTKAEYRELQQEAYRKKIKADLRQFPNARQPSELKGMTTFKRGSHTWYRLRIEIQRYPILVGEYKDAITAKWMHNTCCDILNDEHHTYRHELPPDTSPIPSSLSHKKKGQLIEKLTTQLARFRDNATKHRAPGSKPKPVHRSKKPVPDLLPKIPKRTRPDRPRRGRPTPTPPEPISPKITPAEQQLADIKQSHEA